MTSHMILWGVDVCFLLGAMAGVFSGYWLGVGTGYVVGHRHALIDFHRAARAWYPEDEVHGNLK